ncbi:MAG TPA: T9SS type A sorting domain-containing protein, partial [Puia sp.]
NVLSYNTGVNSNDTTFKISFPYVQTPWSGSNACCGVPAMQNKNNAVTTSVAPAEIDKFDALDIAAPDIFIGAFPNPFVDNNTIRYRVETTSAVRIEVFDETGKLVRVLVDRNMEPGTYSVSWNASGMAKGVYFINATRNGNIKQNIRVVKQ